MLFRSYAVSMKFGKKGVLHGFESILLQDENEEALPVYSIASGLDYPSVGPEHAYLKDCGRIKYEAVKIDISPSRKQIKLVPFQVPPWAHVMETSHFKVWGFCISRLSTPTCRHLYSIGSKPVNLHENPSKIGRASCRERV